MPTDFENFAFLNFLLKKGYELDLISPFQSSKMLFE